MTISASQVFWTVIEAPGVRAGSIPAGVWPLIEEDLPIEVSKLWAVGAVIDGGRLAVCAIRRSDLAAEAGELIQQPQTVPEYIPAPPSDFNFLIGEFEPLSTRRARVRRHIVAAVCVFLASFFMAIGLLRQASLWKVEALAAHAASRSVVASLATKAIWSKDDLVVELLQRRTSSGSELAPAADAGPALAGILAGWPTKVASKVHSISATGNAASITVTIRGDGHAFLAGLKTPEGWNLDEPRLLALDNAMRLNLELHRQREAQ